MTTNALNPTVMHWDYTGTLVTSIDVCSQETDRLIRELHVSSRETNRRMQKTDRHMREMDKLLREFDKQIAGLDDHDSRRGLRADYTRGLLA